MLGNFNKVLVVAPHIDDGEFGCGGAISYMVSAGIEVHYAAFSSCEQSVQPGFPKDILLKEVREATKVLGISPDNLHLFEYNVRKFNFHRQEILDDLLNLRRSINPDVVLIPSIGDLHQDHATIAGEALRAFKFSSILSYELPWNNINFSTTAFVKLEEHHLANKVKALQCYTSQAHPSYADEEFIRALARTRGVQINSRYAEAFEVLRWLLN